MSCQNGFSSPACIFSSGLLLVSGFCRSWREGGKAHPLVWVTLTVARHRRAQGCVRPHFSIFLEACHKGTGATVGIRSLACRLGPSFLFDGVGVRVGWPKEAFSAT